MARKTLVCIPSKVAQHSLLPFIQEPRMLVSKCKPVREQHLVVALMKNFVEFAYRGELLMGFISVEDERKPHVRDCPNGLRLVQQWSMSWYNS
ncbi:hypothetical protein KXD40_008008 [Peronospora effusa]|nr:hypothetical protein KXD40_008008 [Peronospora effusa]